MCEPLRLSMMLMTQERLCADAIGLLQNASASAAARLWIHLCYQAVHGPFEEVPGWEQLRKSSRYRCHLGCILLKTAAISLRTGLWAVLEGQMRIMATGKRDRLRTTTS